MALYIHVSRLRICSLPYVVFFVTSIRPVRAFPALMNTSWGDTIPSGRTRGVAPDLVFLGGLTQSLLHATQIMGNRRAAKASSTPMYLSAN